MANAFATTSGTTYDYTDPTVNKDAFNKVTPREGGFVARNYINWDGEGIPNNKTGQAAPISNIFKLLYIPPRSIIREVIIGKKIGETTIAQSLSGTSGSSDASGAVLNVGVDFNKSASGSSQVQDIDALADHAITKKTGAIAAGAFGTNSASTPWTNVASQSDTSAPTLPFICPYGGYITMQLTGGSNTASLVATMAGDMHIEAVCDYMPE
jgi:hypothetical protein